VAMCTNIVPFSPERIRAERDFGMMVALWLCAGQGERTAICAPLWLF